MFVDAEVVHSTLNALVEDVNKTTELIRRRREEQLIDKKTFQTEMEVKGRISVEPQGLGCSFGFGVLCIHEI